MFYSRRKRIVTGLFSVMLLAGGIAVVMSQNERQSPSPATLMPRNSLLYFSWDGEAAHREAFEKTAAYAAFYESGLMEVVQRVIKAVMQTLPADDSELLDKAVQHVRDHGVTVGLSLSTVSGPPLPYLTIVVHRAAGFEQTLSEIVAKSLGREMTFTTEEIRKRSVTSGVVPNSPGVEIGWWTEGEHLVLAAGIGAINNTIDAATGDAANLTESPLYEKYAASQNDFEKTTVFWIDFGLVRQTYGEFPLPLSREQQVTINNVLEILGLNQIGAVACQSGYKSNANWSQTSIELPGPKQGLFALADQEPITLDDLPPIPFGTNGFYAASFDWGKAYDVIKEIVLGIAALESADSVKEIESAIEGINQELDFNLKSQLLDSLGNVVCVYGDTRQGFMGLGIGLAIEIDDQRALLPVLRTIAQKIAFESDGDVIIRDSAKQGREVFYIEPAEAFFSIAVGVDEKWLVVGLPQTVEGFFLRLDGKLTSWKPTPSYREGLDQLPKSFTSITAVDPRKSYRTIMGLAPFMLGALNGYMRNEFRDFSLPVGMDDIPPAELIARPLFPNLAVTVVDDGGVQRISRSSAPAIPFLDGIGSGGGAATSATMVALLLPAVQQAREAARRTQSRNNLKMIGLALHNYHDAFSSFPMGGKENDGLEGDDRFSWLAAILPYVDQAPLYNQIDFKKPWNDDANSQMIKAVIPVLLNPGVSNRPNDDYGVTHYVGLAGVGEDAAELDIKDEKAGIFGYNRKTRIRDIADGTSNTAMVSEASDDFGPWSAVGKSTIRGLSKKPYINGPDGIGGPYHGGCNVLFADGSVRFISENIDPKLFEALVTMHGGEVIGEIP